MLLSVRADVSMGDIVTPAMCLPRTDFMFWNTLVHGVAGTSTTISGLFSQRGLEHCMVTRTVALLGVESFTVSRAYAMFSWGTFLPIAYSLQALFSNLMLFLYYEAQPTPVPICWLGHGLL